jgi:hypothetical protein
MKSFFIAISLTLFLAGCAISAVKSNKPPQLSAPVKRLFVICTITNANKREEKFLQEMQRNLVTQLAQRGIAVGNEPYDPLSLSTQPQLEAKIKAFQPEAMLSLNMAVSTDPTVEANVCKIDIQIQDFTGDELLWRGNMNVVSAGPKNGQEAASRFANKMLEDKVIS